MPDAPDDLALVERWRAGDGGAGSTLFERHFDSLHRFFHNKTSGGVDDLIQDTWYDCLRAKTGYRGDASFRSYLLVVARHVLYRHLARARPHEALDVAATSVADLGITPTSVAALREEQRVLLHALRALSIELQVMVELYFFEELPAREIAETLGLPEGTVRSRVRRALSALRETVRGAEGGAQAIASTLTTIAGWADAVHERAENS